MLRGRLRTTLFAAGAVLVSAALALGGVAGPASATTPVSTAVARILADTNALRAQNGLAPLVENTAIDAVAQSWAQQMSVQPPSGPGFVHNPNFFSQMPSGATSGGENIAAGYTYTTVVTQGWANSSGHLANMLGTWTDIGIGYYESPDGTSTYFVQDFGYYPSHVGQSSPSPSPSASSTPTPTPTPTPTSTPTATPTPTPTPTAQAAGLVSLSSLPAPVASTATAPIPKVSGNRIINTRTGATWNAHAVNWPSFEYACQQGWGYSQSGATAAAAAAMVSWGITAVRLPLNEDCWLGTDGSPQYGTAAGYQAAVRKFVDVLNAAGLVVILDLHWSGGTGVDSDGQRAMADDQTPLFWQEVSYAYSKAPSVMFDAFNEPYSTGSYQLTWSCWANGGCLMPTVSDGNTPTGSTYAVVGMNSLVSAIRGAGATQPILLAGLDYANDLRGWLANKPSDSQLIASWHNYPGQRCDTATCWNSEIAPVAASVPVIATEFGETDGGTSFLTTFMSWADAHGVGYSPWAWWWTDSSDSAEANAYALLQNGTFQAKAPEGTTYQQHLASVASGTGGGTTAPTPTPTPTTRSYVIGLYEDLLGRMPSSGEIATWVGAIGTITDKGSVARFFQGSTEYDQRMVTQAYQQVLGRTPSTGEVNVWANAIGQGWISADDIKLPFYESDEFYQDAGGTSAGYVASLYQQILGRSATNAEIQLWAPYVAGNRSGVASMIWHSLEAEERRVGSMYTSLLGRSASAGEAQFWAATALAAGETPVRTSIIASAEYAANAQTRFGAD